MPPQKGLDQSREREGRREGGKERGREGERVRVVA